MFSLSLLFSPDMKHYIDVAREKSSYVIKNVETDKITYSIPVEFNRLPRDDSAIIN